MPPPHFSSAPAAGSVPLRVVYWVTLSIAVLLVGQLDPEERLTISSVPVNSIIVGVAAISVLSNAACRGELIKALKWLAPLHALGLTIFWSHDPGYGFWKYGNLFCISSLAIALSSGACTTHHLKSVVKIWLTVGLFLLTLAILTKLQTGFFDRNSPYFLNGPIVFGRQMGVMALLALVFLRGKVRWPLVLIFSLAVAWTFSKGPMAALLGCAVLYVLINADRRAVIGLLAVAALLTTLFLTFFEQIADTQNFDRLQQALNYLSGETQEHDSIDLRVGMIDDSLEVIARYPWHGVGLGGWAMSSFLEQPWPYPHNLFLEVYSEAGIILGTIGLLPFVSFLLYWRRPMFCVPLFLLIAQQFSGDLLDARHLLYFSFLARTLDGTSTAAKP